MLCLVFTSRTPAMRVESCVLKLSPFFDPVAAILWLLDEWLYPEYRQVEIKAPIIIVSVPRAGTTSFHRTIALDEDQLVTPTMLELVLPFCVYKRSSEAAFRRSKMLQRLEACLKHLSGITPGIICTPSSAAFGARRGRYFDWRMALDVGGIIEDFSSSRVLV